MAVIKLGDLTTFTGDPSGSFLVINDSTNTATYKIQKEALMSGSFAGTASYALTASYLSNYIEPFPYTGSAQITGSLEVTGSISTTQNIAASSALFTGNIVAQTLVVQTVTSSVIYSSGSNIFGDDLTDIQQFTGSVRITGSLSLAGGVASLTSSWAERATSSSYAVSASLSTLAGYSKIQETQYRLQNNTVLDQDLWLNQSTIYKIVTGSGLSTLEYKVNAGSYNALSFTGNTWTGTIAVNPLDELSWRITYKAGYTVASFVVVSDITVS